MTLNFSRRDPDFGQLLTVLKRGKPTRPVLFEFFLNHDLYVQLAGEKIAARTDPLAPYARWIHAMANAGYDYSTTPWEFRPVSFPQPAREHLSSVSMAHDGMFTDRAGFEAYPWPQVRPEAYEVLDEIGRKELLPGMKLITAGPGGVLENAIAIVGYEPLCMILADDESLAGDIFDAIGSRILEHYECCLKYDAVGAVIANDDWGFRSQPMLSPDQLRRYVFPWHKKIVEAAHAAGRPAILHSCGNFSTIIEDVIQDMKFDGRHSYEDTIMPVEAAYDRYGKRIGIIGGIDLDFLCRSSPERIYDRSRKMLERSAEQGSYALGSGNSIPAYVPTASWAAMVRAGLEYAV